VLRTTRAAEMSHIRSGDIIVMHDGHEAHQHAGRRHTVETIILSRQARGLAAWRALVSTASVVCSGGSPVSCLGDLRIWLVLENPTQR
jgi:hypothetical protein